MIKYLSLPLALFFVACSSCGKSDPDTLVRGGYDEREMDAAIARARKEVDAFIAEMEKGNGEGFAVKAPIEYQGQTEHFWLTDVVYRNGQFEGIIGNEPGMAKNVRLGQKWTIKKHEISDWMYMRDEKMYGNYTMRPLLKTLPPDEAEEYRKMLANP